MTDTEENEIADLVKRLDHLVALNEPREGGPYQGYAAEMCVKAMREAATALRPVAHDLSSRHQEPVNEPGEWQVTVGTALNFFASVIKSGEPWTATCQAEFDKAHAALTASLQKQESGE